MAGPWQKYGGQTEAAPQQGPIYGPAPVVDPLKVEDQQFQRNAEARAAEDQQFQREKFQWEQQKQAQDRAAGVGVDGKLAESERTAAFLATRLTAAAANLGKIGKSNFGALQPSAGVEAVRGIFGDTPANYLTGADRQVVEADQTDFIDAALTLGTGAAYTAEQLEGYRRAYFPQLGDSAEAVQAKQKKLEVLLAAARLKAGNAAPQIDAALASLVGPAAATGTQDDPADFQGLTGTTTDDSPAKSPTGRDPTPPGGSNDRYSLDNITTSIAQGAGSMVKGAGDIAGALGGNLLGNAMYGALGYDQNYDMGSSLRDLVGLPANPNTMNDAIIRGGTAALGGAAGARSLAGMLAPGVAQSSLQTVGAAPLADTFAGAAAGGGAELARQNGAGPVGQTAAAVLAGGPAIGLASLVNRAPRVPTQFAQAAERQGVDYMAADTGSPTAGRLTGGLSQSFVSAAPIRQAAENTQEQIAAAAGRQARGQAASATTEQAGEGVQNAARRYSQQTSQRGSRLYDRAEQQSQGVQIVPGRALQAIDEQIARASELGGTNAPLLRQLQTLRDDIANGVSVGALRDLRTNLRDRTNADGSLRSDAQQYMFGQIVDTISDDVQDGLNSAGRQGAAALFNRADAFWRDRVQHIDQVLQPITGKDGMRGGEQVVQAIEGMARGNNGGNRRLARLVSNMEPNERSMVRATVIDRLGRATPGQQTADGTGFSASTFLTNWNKMTPQAKNTLFNDADLRANLDDIAILAQGTREGARYANSSNTGGANVVTAASYAFGGMASFKMAATAAALQYGTARLLASPAFARWLAKAPATGSAGAATAYLNRLEVLAGREALIAQDARSFIQAVNDNLSRSPGAAAANEEKLD